MATSVREASEADLDQVLKVEREAFDRDDEAKLVKNLLSDPTAKPLLSLLAFQNNQAVGHVLFTKASLTTSTTEHKVVSCALLAPLAVIPECQRQGVGTKLIKQGLSMLAKSGMQLVFVLGHADYYSRHEFQPAGALGLQAPFEIPPQHANSWMVQELSSKQKLIGTIMGKVVCAQMLNNPEYWIE